MTGRPLPIDFFGPSSSAPESGRFPCTHLHKCQRYIESEKGYGMYNRPFLL